MDFNVRTVAPARGRALRPDVRFGHAGNQRAYALGA